MHGREDGGGNNVGFFFAQGLSSYGHIESASSGLQSLDASRAPNRPNLRDPGCFAPAVRKALPPPWSYFLPAESFVAKARGGEPRKQQRIPSENVRRWR